jgi:chaperonin GroES
MAQTKAAQTMEKTKLQPLGNRVLLKRLPAEDKLKGGIFLPDSAKQKQEQAKVIAVGTGKKDKSGKLIPISVKPGDIVLMEKYSGQEVTLSDEDYIIVKADDLIAVIEK